MSTLPGTAENTDCLSKCKSEFVLWRVSDQSTCCVQLRNCLQACLGRQHFKYCCCSERTGNANCFKSWMENNFFARVVVCFFPCHASARHLLFGHLYMVFLSMLTLTNPDTQMTANQAPPISPRCSLCIAGAPT